MKGGKHAGLFIPLSCVFMLSDSTHTKKKKNI